MKTLLKEMMMWARIKIFFHCLFRFHGSFEARDKFGPFFIACNDCDDFIPCVREEQ